MRSAVILLAAVVAVAAEAPYHLPRPGPHGPVFVYPPGPAPQPPAPFPQLPQRPQQPFLPHPHPPALPPFTPNQGYNYQQPSFGPPFVYPQPAPQPIPVHPPPPVYSVPQPAPQPAPLPIPVHPPLPVYLPAPQPRPIPIPHPPVVHYPQPYPLPVPQPQPVHYPAPQPQPLPIIYPQPHPQPIAPPQTSYGVPQPHPQPLPIYNINVPQAPAAPIAPLPAPLPQLPPAPQPFTSSNHAVIAHHHHQVASQGYSYPQPISQSTQFTAPLPLQSQPLTNNLVSSYQSDSNQYSQNQIHREALDETVVDRVQNIIKESEHSSAKQAGYLSLVSGVSLENARPSVELSSFVHTSPQHDAGLIDVRTASISGGSSSSGTASLSSYDAPIAGSSQSSDSSAIGFLPNTRPAVSYGAPN